MVDLLADIVHAFRPGYAPGRRPTRISTRWWIGIGVSLTLSGAIAIGEEANAGYVTQRATIVRRALQHKAHGRAKTVTLRLEGGSGEVEIAALYDAVGHDTDLPARVELDPDTGVIRAVRFHGHRYRTGEDTEATLVGIAVAFLGVLVLLVGIGRRRQLRVLERAESP